MGNPRPSLYVPDSFPSAEASVGQGERLGRFLVITDRDGRRHAISPGAVSAFCEEEGVVVLLLPGGRCVLMEEAFEEVARFLSWETR